MNKRYELFTSKTCHKCPAFKEFLDSKGIDYTLNDIGEPEALEKARSLNVSSLPAFLILTEIKDLEKLKDYFS